MNLLHRHPSQTKQTGVRYSLISVCTVALLLLVFTSPLLLCPMAGAFSPNDVQDTITKLSHFTLTRYANTAACTLVIYDLFLTIDDTVRLFLPFQ